MAGPAYIDSFRLIRILPDDVTIAADAVDDTLTLAAGPGISLVANAGSDQITIVNTNSAEFSFGVAGDDSSIKTINSGETIRFAGVGPIDIAANSEGAISISWDENAVDWASVIGPSIQATGLPVGTYGRDLSLESLTVDSVTIDTNVITTVDSNANLELRANGSGKVTIDSNNISLGRNAGLTNQGTNGVGVGTQAGQTNQGDYAVSVGSQAGSGSQGTLAVAVGKDAGFSSQGAQSVAVGTSAGYSSQGTFSVALGSNAGIYTQGNYAVAIGYGAGHTNQTTGSIAINAGNSLLNTVGAGFHVNPIRAGDVGLLLKYNTTTKEITYTSDDILVGSISIENNTIQTVDSNADLELRASGTGAVSILGDLLVSGNVTGYQIGDMTGSVFGDDSSILVDAVSNKIYASSITVNGTGGLGYSTGAGGTATQTGSRGNGVTLHKLTGEITLVSSSIASGGIDAFLCSNNLIESTDVVYAQVTSYNPGVYLVVPQAVTSPFPGIYFYLRNIDSFASPNEVVTIRFVVVKSTNS